MQRQTFAALAASLVLFPTLAFADSRTLDVAQFHGVDAASGIRAIVTGGQPYSVIAEANKADDLKDLRYEVRDGVLHLWYDWSLSDLFADPTRRITVTIGTELLDRLEASSGASIEATGLMGEDIRLEASSGASVRTNAIEGMSYVIEVSSGARVETSGLCTDADVEVSSGGSVGAIELDCAKAKLEASSGASLEIGVRESVSAEVSSGAHITVRGKPNVDFLEATSGGSLNFQ